jgi:hypothetical protein
MVKRKKRPSDTNQLAKSVMDDVVKISGEKAHKASKKRKAK